MQERASYPTENNEISSLPLSPTLAVETLCRYLGQRAGLIWFVMSHPRINFFYQENLKISRTKLSKGLLGEARPLNSRPFSGLAMAYSLPHHCFNAYGGRGIDLVTPLSGIYSREIKYVFTQKPV